MIFKEIKIYIYTYTYTVIYTLPLKWHSSKWLRSTCLQDASMLCRDVLILDRYETLGGSWPRWGWEHVGNFDPWEIRFPKEHGKVEFSDSLVLTKSLSNSVWPGWDFFDGVLQTFDWCNVQSSSELGVSRHQVWEAKTVDSGFGHIMPTNFRAWTHLKLDTAAWQDGIVVCWSWSNAFQRGSKWSQNDARWKKCTTNNHFLTILHLLYCCSRDWICCTWLALWLQECWIKRALDPGQTRTDSRCCGPVWRVTQGLNEACWADKLCKTDIQLTIPLYLYVH